MSAAQSHPATKPAAILSPWVDTLCIGGGSIVLMLALLLVGGPDWLGAEAQMGWWVIPMKATLTVVINMPHFLASYRIVYRSKEMILRYKSATIYVPLLIIGYSAFAIWQAPVTPTWITLLMLVAGGYLAWHYTGQAWGMMATYAYLSGRPFKKSEVWLIRSGLRIMLVWHLIWFLYVQNGDDGARAKIYPVFQAISYATILAVALGIIGLALYSRRTGALPEKRVLVPWVAVFIWYFAMSRHPGAIFWVQMAHGLQYLIFPIRVELNRMTADGEVAPSQRMRHMMIYAIAMLGVGFLIMEYVPDLSAKLVGNWLDERAVAATMMTPLAFLNIHHYFTDGCIWKLRNPEVRKDLFGHLETSKGAA